jgi:hypothetical protein
VPDWGGSQLWEGRRHWEGAKTLGEATTLEGGDSRTKMNHGSSHAGQWVFYKNDDTRERLVGAFI